MAKRKHVATAVASDGMPFTAMYFRCDVQKFVHRFLNVHLGFTSPGFKNLAAFSKIDNYNITTLQIVVEETSFMDGH